MPKQAMISAVMIHILIQDILTIGLIGKILVYFEHFSFHCHILAMEQDVRVKLQLQETISFVEWVLPMIRK